MRSVCRFGRICLKWQAVGANLDNAFKKVTKYIVSQKEIWTFLSQVDGCWGKSGLCFQKGHQVYGQSALSRRFGRICLNWTAVGANLDSAVKKVTKNQVSLTSKTEARYLLGKVCDSSKHLFFKTTAGFFFEPVFDMRELPTVRRGGSGLINFFTFR